MSKVYKSVIDLIGKTPVVKIENIQKKLNIVDCDINLKLEFFNPGGSVKDRPVREIILDGLNKGLITKESIICEATSGNTGIAAAMICSALGLKCYIFMPDSMSDERKRILKSYNANLILTDGNLGMQGAIEALNEFKAKYNNVFVISQFTNKLNPESHYNNTAKEIISDLDGKVDILISCIGSGGTITGLSKGLKEYNSNIKIIGVEPEESPLITKGFSGKHKIEGIGANFIPEILNVDGLDGIELVSYEEAKKCCNMLSKYEGLLVGKSSGACLQAAINIAKKEENKGKVIVCICPDSGERYLTTDLFN